MINTIIPNILYTSSKNNHQENNGCELIGTFSLLTQALLGLLCLSSLILKRFYEYPIRRTWPVWIFDVSKQLIGALGVHIFNIMLSVLKTAPEVFTKEEEDDDEDNACDWYFLNMVLDCTIGVYILYLVFKLLNYICKNYFHITQIKSGEYGNINKPSVKAWLKQLVIYFTSLMITKIILYLFVEIFEVELIWITSHILLRWLDEYSNEFEIFIVMFIIPILLNCLQLILIDNFLKNQVWFNSNKLLKLKYPNFNDESESVRNREINEVFDDEERIENQNYSSHSKSSDDNEDNSDLFKKYGSTNE
ncbi:uncharacterized protein KGF55_004541 [Candida pseudojiufengensis]|uniref:uncharacterized protein n=1 Tax=Candida pseudojiufengensis TaxID=497109 RepID=UPI0022251531|nr:uncharacterized protein KGF55_004541 [Candida pseudojiufengensis]KAI5960648.1 hypothetical protein KGF55_004541 [Candida pseudojiufengensis]